MVNLKKYLHYNLWGTWNSVNSFFYRGSVCMKIITRYLLGKALLSNFDRFAYELGAVTTATHKWPHSAFCIYFVNNSCPIERLLCVLLNCVILGLLKDGFNCLCGLVQRVASDEWGRMWKETILSHFTVLFRHFVGGGLELYPNIRFSEGGFNLITAEYEACEFELLCHDVNLYFGTFNFVWPN
jgi:hypothetical protein